MDEDIQFLINNNFTKLKNELTFVRYGVICQFLPSENLWDIYAGRSEGLGYHRLTLPHYVLEGKLASPNFLKALEVCKYSLLRNTEASIMALEEIERIVNNVCV